MNITAFAQYAGVSKAAVSRYFNGGYLSAEKRAQIAAAVEATGYRPSMQAQMLRTRRTRQIGVIMPRLSSESCARMVEGISRVLDDQNYQLLLINTANDNTREVRALDTLRHDTVDGIILIATMFTPEHHAVLQSLHVPVVIVGQQYPGFSCVFHDDFGAAQAATAHMLQKGRRKPGYLGVTLLDKAVGLARREGFDSALRDAGLVPQPQRMSIAKFNMESGYHQAEQLFGRAPGLDCLFCATDSIALGALQYCRSHSLRVPEATMAGMMGTKISPSVLMARWYHGALEAAACLTSSLLAPVIPARAVNSSYTLFTMPVPKMICSWPWASNTPLAPSAFSSSFLFTLELSAITRRRRVAQCAADTMLEAPPMLSSTCWAAFL